MNRSCPCGDNDGQWCSLPDCPYLKSGRVDFVLFGMTVEAVRVKRGMTRRQLAYAADVLIDDVDRAISGRDPGMSVFHALCGWMNHAPEAFQTPKVPHG